MSPAPVWNDDRAALRAACADGVGLCTIVGIEGSFSRRVGAQLAVGPDGSITGSLADGCLEKQLAREVLEAAGTDPFVRRFGAGSPLIDFRLPCGSGLDILIEPAPDRDLCRAVVARLDARQAGALDLPGPDWLLLQRRYIPPLRLVLLGEGPELAALAAIATAAGVMVERHAIGQDAALALGRRPQGLEADAWTAVVLLFHDHEWEQAILEWALETPAFHIGAQGGAEARAGRAQRLAQGGASAADLARITSPVGLIPRSREPGVLAISILAQVTAEYEALHPHG
jgi:xanthine dehydrogenase accessory factor